MISDFDRMHALSRLSSVSSITSAAAEMGFQAPDPSWTRLWQANSSSLQILAAVLPRARKTSSGTLSLAASMRSRHIREEVRSLAYSTSSSTHSSASLPYVRHGTALWYPPKAAEYSFVPSGALFALTTAPPASVAVAVSTATGELCRPRRITMRPHEDREDLDGTAVMGLRDSPRRR